MVVENANPYRGAMSETSFVGSLLLDYPHGNIPPQGSSGYPSRMKERRTVDKRRDVWACSQVAYKPASCSQNASLLGRAIREIVSVERVLVRSCNLYVNIAQRPLHRTVTSDIVVESVR